MSGWIHRRQQASIEYLRTENEVLRESFGSKRIPLNDDQRRRLTNGQAPGPTTTPGTRQSVHARHEFDLTRSTPTGGELRRWRQFHVGWSDDILGVAADGQHIDRIIADREDRS